MEFNIGDRVQVREYAEMPDYCKNKGIAKLHGLVGTIVDKLASEASNGFLYRVRFDNSSRPSTTMFTDEQLHILLPINLDEYSFKYEILDNVVVARFFDGETELGRGYGHIIHDGALGIAQAASYALKKLYQNMVNNN